MRGHIYRWTSAQSAVNSTACKYRGAPLSLRQIGFCSLQAIEFAREVVCAPKPDTCRRTSPRSPWLGARTHLSLDKRAISSEFNGLQAPRCTSIPASDRLLQLLQRSRSERDIGCAALVSAQKVVIDNGPCFRKRLLLRRSQDVIRLRSQESRAWRYMHPPTGPLLDGVQAVSSILNMICGRL
jgi:hypothetical protein